MKDTDMRTVEAAFSHLHPICVEYRRVKARGGSPENPGRRYRWKACTAFPRTEIRPDDAAGLDDGIGRGLQLRRPLVGRNIHDVEHRTVGSELPAVIEAPDAAILDTSERKRGSAMDAEFVEHADLAVLAAKHDEVFAQQPFGARCATGLRQPVRGADRHPEPAKQRPHRSARADAAKAIILLFGHHRRISPRLNIVV